VGGSIEGILEILAIPYEGGIAGLETKTSIFQIHGKPLFIYNVKVRLYIFRP
jgi:hypothetical protein